ncbi:MAG: hypothetical protein ACRDH8_07990 [Actinomycetota bacterium]
MGITVGLLLTACFPSIRVVKEFPGSFSPRYSPDGSTIVFVSDRDGNEEIYTANADGGTLRRLTNHPASDLDPTWSPDGDEIVFNSDREGLPPQLFVMDASGRNQTRLTPTGTPGSIFPSISPDGRQIVFGCGRDLDEMDLCLASRTKPVLGTTLLSLPGRQWQPAWSPDGERIAFVSAESGDDEIYTVAPDGTGLTRLTESPGRDADPAWSPDGSQIVFSSNREGGGLYTMGSDGAGVKQLTAGIDATPAWSPDGSTIVYYRQTDTGSRIFVVGTDGSLPRMLPV